ncbi:MAG: alpha/beta fold hydrolase [Enhygromyxa sp.]
MNAGAQELVGAAPLAAAPAGSLDPWPTLRVVADDGVEELMFLHEGVGPREWTRPRAAVLIIPTIDAPARAYVTLAAALAKAGFHVARAELRGQGYSSAPLSTSSGYGELVERAIPAMVASLRRRWGKLPIYLLGHGAGGQLACLFAARGGFEVEGLIVVGCSGGDPWRERIAKFGRALLPSQPRARLLDWARAGRRLCGSERDWERALARVRLPILSLALAEDRESPRASVEALLARMPRARCEQVTVGGRQATHHGWLERPGMVVEQVCRWQRRPRNRTGPRVCIARELLPQAAGFSGL